MRHPVLSSLYSLVLLTVIGCAGHSAPAYSALMQPGVQVSTTSAKPAVTQTGKSTLSADPFESAQISDSGELKPLPVTQIKQLPPQTVQDYDDEIGASADPAQADIGSIDVDELGAPISSPEPTLSPEDLITLKMAEKKAEVFPEIKTQPTQNPMGQAINDALWYQGMTKNDAMTVKLQILLDWNHTSPGPIDNGWGMNSKKALRGFEHLHGLDIDGRMDAMTFSLLHDNFMGQDAIVDYVITEEDANYDFSTIPSGYPAKSKLKWLGYTNLIELLGERFHMDVRFLKKLNPTSEFKAGDTIAVVNTGATLDRPINRIEVNKADQILYAFDGDEMVATYPTTIGSSSTPSPEGTHTVINSVYLPWYSGKDDDNPKKRWPIAPGPNNPVGMVWNGLSKPSYGIHGSPVPEGISRQASHGCVRLTNWDVLEFYSAVQIGATVNFID